MYEPVDNRKIKGKCPSCYGQVLEFTACYVCQNCKIVWSIAQDEWKVCAVCVFADEGTCSNCAGENFGHTTEIASKGKCENWTEKK